ncbi:hypothetical protein [Absidia glauca]|uniref:Ndc10 domain-containing protein n=1 Tax=Absidia glauca TaxID=4829 RepID=A0A168MLI5_ABSGL|nr:hypothetical protein [Absidia glauca]
MTGFPTNGRSFYLARAALDPPSSLCKKLFPAIDEWNDRLAAKKLNPDNNDPIQPTVAANAFVPVIMMLRKTFVQDSVLMMELRPCHPSLLVIPKIDYDDDDGNRDDDDANDDSTTTSCRPIRCTHPVHSRLPSHCTDEVHYPMTHSQRLLLLILWITLVCFSPSFSLAITLD